MLIKFYSREKSSMNDIPVMRRQRDYLYTYNGKSNNKTD